MEFRNEPQVRQEWQLSKIVIVSSALVGIFALGVFLFNNLYPSSDVRAADKGGNYYELNGSVGDDYVKKVFESVKDGDTLAITEKFVIGTKFKDLYEKNIVLKVDGYLVWTIAYPLYLGKEAKIIFGEKAEIVTEGKTCSENTSIQFGGKSLASCNGKNASFSFEEVLKAGGLDANGLIEKSKAYKITGTTKDKENEAIFKEVKNGDTVIMSGKFLVSEDFDKLKDVDIVLIIEEGWLIWEKDYAFYLSKESKLILGKNGGLYDGNCDGKMFLYIYKTEMASCNGKSAKFSFAEVNKAGGIDKNGLSKSIKTHKIKGATTDKENVAVFEQVQDGDTIKMSDKFVITEDFKDLAEKDVIIVVEEGLLIWEKDYSVYLSRESKVLLGTNGEMYDGNCDGEMLLYFDNAEMASCNGKSAKYSFAEINKVGGISYEGLAALPVELIRFETKRLNGAVVLNWATASEHNNSHFEVERSQDGKTWAKIGTVPGNGNSQKIINYTYEDRNAELGKVVYYRLKQNDFDGVFEYSFVRMVSDKIEAGTSLTSVYPNPVDKFLNVKIDDFGTYQILLLDQTGQIKYQMETSQSLETINTSSFQMGVYYVTIQNDRMKESHKIVIRH